MFTEYEIQMVALTSYYSRERTTDTSSLAASWTSNNIYLCKQFALSHPGNKAKDTIIRGSLDSLSYHTISYARNITFRNILQLATDTGYQLFATHLWYTFRHSCWHIEAETKWPPFHRRHIQMHFLEWKCRLRFHWRVFLMFESRIFQHCFR